MKPFQRARKPGEFRARCSRSRWVPLETVLSWPRSLQPDTVRSHYDRKLGCEVVGVQCEFETSDRDAFEHHVRTVHGGPVAKIYSGSWQKDPIPGNPHHERRAAVTTHQGGPLKPWRAPKLLPEGRPLKTDAPVSTCSTCGLVAEVNDREASQLWWAEHERMCVAS